jgi:uncharacterized protein involved in oxidation of intracellular sulfur
VKALIVINDAPYGSERPYNAVRVASTLSARTEVELRVFLARGLAEEQLVEGAHRSTIEELADWIQRADRTRVF